ncbi:sensor histidine kinase [Massilia sp. TS11]|uniref:sensor histidine kinase n=1 Tax=Massilia sp. TS11 TaxID=2908003 RepID=UPI001EDB2675|nr:ATP-binding protein [Massilia sp. TS11]MCG2586853.1 ATP-binding protein [Massilia sp. TS11]
MSADAEAGEDPAVTIARLRAELQEARSWRARIEQGFDRLQSGIVMYGPDDVLLFCNRGFRAIYPEIADLLQPGTPYHVIARAFYQREFHKRTDLNEDDYVRTRVARHLAPDECDAEYRLNEQQWVMASDRRTDDGGVIGFRLDITERKRAEQRLAEAEQRQTENLERMVQERTEALLAANRELERTLAELRDTQQQLVQSEKLASLGFLVAGVAHEINTPIGNALLMGTDMLEETTRFAAAARTRLTKSLFEQHLEYLHEAGTTLVSNLQRAGRLVQGFKQLALDRATEQRRQFVLRDVVDEVVLAMGPRLRQARHGLQVAVPDEIVFDSYPGPLTQVLVNLINNALAHAFAGREDGQMALTVQAAAPGQCLLLFRDDGCGMAPDVAEHVFDPFFTTKLGQGGSGLGMHIAYNICTQLLGGSIQVETAPGAGTCWRLQLPLRAP